jgi:hypothetical protein
MNVDSVNEVMQVLHRIESLASTWVLPTSSDAESSRNAYERIRSVCRSIAGTLDDVLLDRVEDSDADSDNEPDNVCIFFFATVLVLTFIYQPVRESSSEKSARIAYDRSQCILSRVGSAVTASEFAALFNDHPSASRQKQEDDSLVKLYRGYDDSDLDSWVSRTCIRLLHC